MTSSRLPRATKRCAGTCRRLLPIKAEFFHRDEQSLDGHQSYCKDCKARATLEARWLREYGITPRLAQQCLSLQGDACPVCMGVLDFSMRVHVDHDHDTEEVRGFLHGPCNTGPPKNGEGASRWRTYCDEPPMRRANGGDPLIRMGSGLALAQLELL